MVVDLCARHQLSGEKYTYVLAAFEQERAEKEKRDGEIARLKAAARTADSDRRDLQSRYDAALVATASRQEKAELLTLRSDFRNLEERAQRLEAANRQLERLAQDNDIAVPDSVEMFRPLVSEWAAWSAKAGRRPGAGREARQRQWQLTLPITSFCFCLCWLRQSKRVQAMSSMSGVSGGSHDHRAAGHFTPRAVSAYAPASSGAAAAAAAAATAATSTPRWSLKRRASVQPVSGQCCHCCGVDPGARAQFDTRGWLPKRKLMGQLFVLVCALVCRRPALRRPSSPARASRRSDSQHPRPSTAPTRRYGQLRRTRAGMRG